MPVTQEIRDALDLNNLNLPPEPKVLAIDVEEFYDRDGDEMLRVLVTIDEDTDVEKWPGQAILDFKHAIRNSLRSRGVTLFPIVQIAKPSELQDEQSQG